MPYNNRSRRGPSGSFGGPGRSFKQTSRRGTTKGKKRTGEYINPARFIQPAKPTVQTEYIAKHAFSDFDINEVIQKNLADNGYTTPSPIQDQSIPFGVEGHDIVGVANTGTGKTAAFAIPIIHNAMRFKDAYALIVAPTRELAQQIEQEMRKIGKNSGLTSALLIGGTPMGPQLGQLRANPQIVIGTPGRIKDHIERRTFDVAKFNMIVLDEVDRMLDMGFLPDVKSILELLAPERQSYFFSATLDARVKSLITTFAPKHITVSVKTADTSENVEQNVVRYESTTHKIEKLHDILIDHQDIKVIVFDETQRNVEKLANELQTRGFSVTAIHGGKTQGQRKRALDEFKANKAKIMVATDVAARGIDVKDITHVINYSVPQTYDDYVHRIGRAGRAGKTGYALTFVGK
jgi:superfamily II DNA/RNA helicase